MIVSLVFSPHSVIILDLLNSILLVIVKILQLVGIAGLFLLFICGSNQMVGHLKALIVSTNIARHGFPLTWRVQKESAFSRSR